MIKWKDKYFLSDGPVLNLVESLRLDIEEEGECMGSIWFKEIGLEASAYYVSAAEVLSCCPTVSTDKIHDLLSE